MNYVEAVLKEQSNVIAKAKPKAIQKKIYNGRLLWIASL